MATPKPKITVELEPGSYLVDVHPSYPPRIWRYDFTGIITGANGVRLRKPSIVSIFNELIIDAEKREGIRGG